MSATLMHFVKFSPRMYHSCMVTFSTSCRGAPLFKKADTGVQENAVVLSEDGNTILCWHPEPTFPYENTKPLPRKDEALYEADSALKVQHLQSEKFKYKPDGPTKEELSNMFHTPIQFWRHRPGKRRMKRNPPKDRDSV